MAKKASYAWRMYVVLNFSLLPEIIVRHYYKYILFAVDQAERGVLDVHVKMMDWPHIQTRTRHINFH